MYRSDVVEGDIPFVVVDDATWNGATDVIANNKRRIASIGVGKFFVDDGILMELLLLFRIVLGLFLWMDMFIIF